jgi:flagellar hook-associated protein 3 FlgL
MRVTTQTVALQVNVGLQRAYQQLARAQEVVASGQRINRLSDDPLGAVRVVELRGFEAAIAQYVSNSDQVKPLLEQSDTVFGEVVQQLTRAREIAVQMGNAVYSPAEKATAAGEIGQILDQLIAVANTKVENRFIFGGYKSSNPPFLRTPGGADYVGDAGKIQIHTSPSSTMDINFLGNEVFQSAGVPGGQGIFDVMHDLACLLDGRNVSDSVNIAVTLDDTIPPGAGFSQIDAVGTETARIALLAEADFSTSVTVFDGNGIGHDLVFAFAKTSADTYHYRVFANASEINGGTLGNLYQVAPGGLLKFDGNGVLDAAASIVTDVTMSALSSGAADINIDAANLSFAGSMQAPGESAVLTLQQSNAGGIAAQLGRLDAAIDHIVSYRTQVGARLNSAEASAGALEILRARTIGERSRFEDADVLSAYSDFVRLQSAFEASLASASRMLAPSLLDFLR